MKTTNNELDKKLHVHHSVDGVFIDTFSQQAPHLEDNQQQNSFQQEVLKSYYMNMYNLDKNIDIIWCLKHLTLVIHFQVERLWNMITQAKNLKLRSLNDVATDLALSKLENQRLNR